MDLIQDVRQAEGRRISKVYDADDDWHAYPCQTKVPPGTHLMNFDLVFGPEKKQRTVLCLDNYGNEVMSSDLHRRLLNLDLFDYLIGIDRQSGVVYYVPEDSPQCVIDVSSEVGEHVAQVFTGIMMNVLGEDKFQIRRIEGEAALRTGEKRG